jgi:preprotein translocase subunit SecE
MNIIQKPINFIREVKAELGKVAWSTREEIMGSTMVVIVVTAIMAVFIGVIDILLTKILQMIFK